MSKCVENPCTTIIKYKLSKATNEECRLLMIGKHEIECVIENQPDA